MGYFPLYSTRGDLAGYLINAYIYDRQGEWIGWLDRDSCVFSVSGEYVGWLSKDFRILRKSNVDESPPRHRPPARPPLHVLVPPSAPLPPLMAELGYDVLDVFDETPARLHVIDADPAARDID